MNMILFKFCVHVLFVFVNSIRFATCLNQMSCNRGKTDGETKRIKDKMFFSTKMFWIWTKSISMFFRRFVCWKTRRKQVAIHNLIKNFKFLFCFSRFARALGSTRTWWNLNKCHHYLTLTKSVICQIDANCSPFQLLSLLPFHIRLEGLKLTYYSLLWILSKYDFPSQ